MVGPDHAIGEPPYEAPGEHPRDQRRNDGPPGAKTGPGVIPARFLGHERTEYRRRDSSSSKRISAGQRLFWTRERISQGRRSLPATRPPRRRAPVAAATRQSVRRRGTRRCPRRSPAAGCQCAWHRRPMSGTCWSAPLTKFVITKSSSDSTKASRNPATIAGKDHRERHLEERDPRRREQILRRVLERRVLALDARPHGDRDERDRERDVREQDRSGSRAATELDEHGQQR